MRLHCGTSGFAYDEWRERFYPADLPKDAMLGFYAARLPTVELNNTFYRMPRTSVVERWRDETPDGFRFVIKATRRITHFARLADCADAVGNLFRVAGVLGQKLGPMLFQLPPMMRKDAPRLETFLRSLPEGRQVAFEFRHASWFGEEIFELLRGFGAALVGGDSDGAGDEPPWVRTAPYGYLRLRRSGYSDDELDGWYRRLCEQGFDEAYAFFKHESDGPALARRFIARASAG